MDDTEKTTLLEEEPTGSGSPATTGSHLSKLKGLAAMLIFTLMMSSSEICLQALDRSVPDFELNAMRCGFAMICMMFYLIFTRTLPTISRENILPVFVLGLLENLVTIGCYVSVTFIPLAWSECIKRTSTLLSGLVIFKMCVKEKLNLDKVIAAPLCVVGVFLVLQPPGIFSQKDTAKIYSHILTYNVNISDENYMKNSSLNMTSSCDINYELEGNAILGYIIGASSGTLFTLEVSIVKYYGDFFTAENLFRSLIWFYVLGTVLSLIPTLIFEHPVFPSQTKDILLVFAHVCTYVFTMPLYLYASLLISGNLVSITSTNILLFVLAAQYTILKDIHPGHRNWIEILGVILVLFGNIFSSLMEILRGSKNKKETTEN